MKLYFNGCSHTFGDDLEDRSKAWPSLIANELNCKFVNDAVSGGTNDRIIYRTMKHAHDFDRFYIAWTYTSRFTRYRSDNNYDVNFNSQLNHALYGKNSEFVDYGKLHYSFWHNELYAFKIWLQNIILLQHYLTSIGKTYVMVNADRNFVDRWSVSWPLFNDSVKSLVCFDLMDDDILYQEHNEIQNLLKQIDTNNYAGWNSWWITQLCSKHPVGATGHLLQAGHQAVANYILEHDSI